MINKLLLVRTAFVKATLLDGGNLSQLAHGEPIKVIPVNQTAGWNEESKPSHYGYVFKDLKLDARDKLVAFDEKTDGTSLHELDAEANVPAALKSLGLMVHPLA